MCVLLFPGSKCCFVMQISMRTQIWVLVSMMDFMPGKGEHEICIFCHFYGKSGATLWRYVHVTVMSHININKFSHHHRKGMLKCYFLQ